MRTRDKRRRRTRAARWKSIQWRMEQVEARLHEQDMEIRRLRAALNMQEKR